MRVVGVSPARTAGRTLRLFELPKPHAGPGKVRIGFDPAYVPGMDVTGIIDEIGPDTVTNLALGDRVKPIVLPRGSHDSTATVSCCRPHPWRISRQGRRSSKPPHCR